MPCWVQSRGRCPLGAPGRLPSARGCPGSRVGRPRVKRRNARFHPAASTAACRLPPGGRVDGRLSAPPAVLWLAPAPPVVQRSRTGRPALEVSARTDVREGATASGHAVRRRRRSYRTLHALRERVVVDAHAMRVCDEMMRCGRTMKHGVSTYSPCGGNCRQTTSSCIVRSFRDFVIFLDKHMNMGAIAYFISFSSNLAI